MSFFPNRLFRSRLALLGAACLVAAAAPRPIEATALPDPVAAPVEAAMGEPDFDCGSSHLPLGVAMIRAARADRRDGPRAAAPRANRQEAGRATRRDGAPARAGRQAERRATPAVPEALPEEEPSARLMNAIYACVAAPMPSPASQGGTTPHGVGPIRAT
ncbi:hypothetical protein M0638_07955 [Roseomonas sp. NAR14]|uniref:Uncharacterized protein n=1 Tax=Roseomonas acroporae TaxID=2937791 RepID=A0A9X1Y8N6_9PROT|nr:hypothetical protein [Roseomonas acroporae]MCK8784310.1 hypothetical protein [Roseomonas acroporae]